MVAAHRDRVEPELVVPVGEPHAVDPGLHEHRVALVLHGRRAVVGAQRERRGLRDRGTLEARRLAADQPDCEHSRRGQGKDPGRAGDRHRREAEGATAPAGGALGLDARVHAFGRPDVGHRGSEGGAELVGVRRRLGHACLL